MGVLVNSYRFASSAASETADLNFLTGADLSAMQAAGYEYLRDGTARLLDDTAFDADTPRIDPSRGYYSEGGRANLVTFASALGSLTAAGTDTVTANIASTPSGRDVIDRWQPAAGANRRISVITKQGWTYTISGYARLSAGTNALQLHHANSADGTSTSITATGTRQRFSVSVLGRTGGGSVDCGWRNNSGSPTYELDSLQVELGAFASAPVSTAGAVIQREPDTCVARRPAWPSISVLLRATSAPGVDTFPGSTEQVLWQADCGWNDDRVYLYRDSSRAVQAVLVVDDVVVVTLSLGTLADNTSAGFALALEAGRFAAVKTSGTVQSSDIAGVTLPAWTFERLGHDAGGNHWFGYIARCKWVVTPIATVDLSARAAAVLAGTEPSVAPSLGSAPAALFTASGRPQTWRAPFRGEPIWRSTVSGRTTHASSANYVSKFWNSQYVPSGQTMGNLIAFDREYTFSLYWIEQADDTYTITATNGNYGSGSIPWKSTWNVTGGTDRQFILASLLTGEIIEAWEVTINHGAKTIAASRCNRDNREDTESYRGAILDWRSSNARATPARGSGTSCLAGMILPEEIEGGAIKHPLSLALSGSVARNTFVHPAYKSDGTQTATDMIPEGTHFQLQLSGATIDSRAAAIPSPATAGQKEFIRLTARALADYGMIAIDFSGFSHVHAEPDTSAGTKWTDLGVKPEATSGSIRHPQDLLRYVITSSSEWRALAL
jgi:hypothetical protein